MVFTTKVNLGLRSRAQRKEYMSINISGLLLLLHVAEVFFIKTKPAVILFLHCI